MKCLLAPFLIGLATAAQAADAVQEIGVVDEVHNWSGAYAGATVGATFYEPEWTDHANDWFQGSLSFESTSALIGAYVGYNIGTGPLILGVEGDFVGTFNSDERGGPDYDEIYENNLDWLLSLRGRVGLPNDKLLFFATGGIALAGVTNKSVSSDWPDEDFTDTASTLTGFAVGGGLEYAIRSNVNLRLEGLYYDLGSKTYAQDVDPKEHMTIDNQVFVVRTGIGFQF